MKIDVLTVAGSPDNVTPATIYERGVGGAELALMSWAKVMAERGHEITIFNQTNGNFRQAVGTPTYVQKNAFSPDVDRDILITFRGPQDIALGAKGKKIGWSCDQMTMGNYVAWYRDVEEMIVISEFHKKDHLERYGSIAEKAKVIDLGVRTWEYRQNPNLPDEYKLQAVSKIPHQFIYCSVPDRGLNELAYLWPRVKSILPDAKLVITSDYTLWGASDPLNTPYRLRFAGMQDVRFVGNVNRKELVRHQLESEVQLYPCVYDENFCIACAECQVAGCYPITSNRGALETTNKYGVFADVNNLDSFLEPIQKFCSLADEERQKAFFAISHGASQYFDWNRIAEEWEELFI